MLGGSGAGEARGSGGSSNERRARTLRIEPLESNAHAAGVAGELRHKCL